MESIGMEVRNGVALVRLCHGATNALGPELVSALTAKLRAVKEDPAVRAVVLASASDRFFSIGLDLPSLLDLPPEAFAAFYQDFGRLCLELYTIPRPTVAAISGHAIAGGCILALCCDHRIIAEGRRLMGLNEVKLGVPVPYLADCILRQHAGVRSAWEMVSTGEFYPPEVLFQMGLVDQVLPLEQVLPKAVEKAQALGALPAEAFGAIKQARVQAVLDQVLPRQEEKDRLFVTLWYSDTARERLREALKKF